MVDPLPRVVPPLEWELAGGETTAVPTPVEALIIRSSTKPAACQRANRQKVTIIPNVTIVNARPAANISCTLITSAHHPTMAASVRPNDINNNTQNAH